jgi:intracellular sulfur oxidation DsrE/DsrF family protein
VAVNRTSFIASGIALTPGLSHPGLAAVTIPGGSDLVERRDAFDERAFDALVRRRAEVRQVWDNAALKPAVLNNIKNALNGFVFGFGYAPDAVAIAVVNHAGSAAYTYDDTVWKNYRIAEFLGVPNASAVTTNVYRAARSETNPAANPNDERGYYQDASIETLQHRGVMFFTCHTAVQEQARALVRGGFAPAGMSPSAVADDILTHLIPGAMVVPSGVATVSVLQQRYGYHYITVQS